MVRPVAGNPAVDARIERVNDQYSVHLGRSDGDLPVTPGAQVTGGSRPKDEQ
ncbi:hypothetical protein ABZ814_11695 [Micromonospora musae]|uniref:hypothetical protein n=1 Tax=Micromonospora musae TaxID=1894970 RepID=UPI0033F79509